MSATATYPSGNASGLWEPRRTLTLEAARRHSQTIRVIRWGLIALCLALIGLLVYEFSGQDEPVIVEIETEGDIVMTNPRYNGKNDDGLPYDLIADQAIRLMGEENIVELVNPILEFYRTGGDERSIVIAKKGSYDDKNKILNLYTDVDLTTDDGNHCITTHARIFTQTKYIEGDDPIQCTGNFGEVNGNAYEIHDNYSRFVFKAGMDAIIEQ